MTISRLIYFSIFMMLVLFAVSTYINFNESQKVAENANDLARSSNIIRLGSQLQKNILNMEKGLRGYLITNEKYFLQSYDTPKNANIQIIHELHNLLTDSVQVHQLDKIATLYIMWVDQYAERIKNVKPVYTVSGTDDEFLRNNSLIIEEVGTNKEIQKYFNQLINGEYKKQLANKEVLLKSEMHTKTVSLLLTIFTILVVITIAIFLERQISLRLKKMIRMTDSIGEGNFKVYVSDSEHDELSELTQSLNHMTQMLDQHVGLLERKNHELDQFANVVSHDLKAPLRGIENVINWIEEDHKTELPLKVQEYVALIKGRILRAEKLIEGILKYARVGKEKNEVEPVDLNILLHEIIDSIPKEKQVTFDIQADLPVLRTEKVPLSQVFSNLITNAIKHNRKDRPLVKVYFLDLSNQYKFFVEDNGPGIDATYHEKIFVIFQTLNADDSNQNTGIGLAIVKKILDERKEQIRIESTPGKGTTFSFTWSKF